MSRSARAWYGQILAACHAGGALRARGREAFDDDELLQRAAKNICLELGEAAKQIAADDPEEFVRTGYERWPLVVRMRDFYGHNHPVTDLNVLWDTIVVDLPLIRRAVEGRLAALDDAAPPAGSH